MRSWCSDVGMYLFAPLLHDFWDCFGTTVGLWLDYFGIVLGSFGDSSWIRVGSCWDRFEIVVI